MKTSDPLTVPTCFVLKRGPLFKSGRIKEHQLSVLSRGFKTHKNSSLRAFTLIELLVVVSIIAVLISLTLPNILKALTKGEMTQTLSNERQLYLATQAMALDTDTLGSSTLGWPGDTTTPSFSAWANGLCNGYLSTNDFCKLCSAPGVVLSKMPTAARETAFKIYPIQEGSESDAIFMITKNATLHGSKGGTTITLDPATKPYGSQGCVIMHRGGDGEIILAHQLTNSHVVGSLITSGPLE